MRKKQRGFYIYSKPRDERDKAWQLIGEGVQFAAGKVVVNWRNEISDIETYQNMIDAYNAITSYNMVHWDTRLIWIEDTSYFNFLLGDMDWDHDPQPAVNKFITKLEIYEPADFVRTRGQ